jgi:hypothetical protein
MDPNHISLSKGPEGIQIHYKNLLVASGLKLYSGIVEIDLDTLDRTDFGYLIYSTVSSVQLKVKIAESVTFVILPNDMHSDVWKMCFGQLYFEDLVQFWRYVNKNERWAWTIPIKIKEQKEFRNYVNFAYWRLDGAFGALIPLGGGKYRSTISGDDMERVCVEASSDVSGEFSAIIPIAVLGFGSQPYTIFKECFRTCAIAMGKENNLVENKKQTEVWSYLGWCSWNSSDLGKNLNSEWLKSQCKIITEKQTFGWILIDDGWMDANNVQSRSLNSFLPQKSLFPMGFQDLKDFLVSHCRVKHLGVWHTLNGYWDGISVDSELGAQFKDSLYTYNGKDYWISPDTPELTSFYNNWYRALSSNGISFTKVDNQFNAAIWAGGIHSVFSSGEAMHKALNDSASRFMDNNLLNCMCMTSENYYNFGTSVYSRVSEDYFPDGIGYDMRHGNAAAHLTQAIYNSIYFSQFVITDFDMFETYNPHADIHAVARSLNNGPIYITDYAGRNDYKLLKKLCYSDGRLVHAQTPLLPSEDSLFVVQDHELLKFVSTTGSSGAILACNFADADSVTGSIKVEDVGSTFGGTAKQFILFDYKQRKILKATRKDALKLTLSRMEWQLFFVFPDVDRACAIGVIEKFNCPATIQSTVCTDSCIDFQVYEGGETLVYTKSEPWSVTVDGKSSRFFYKDGLLAIDCGFQPDKAINIRVSFNPSIWMGEKEPLLGRADAEKCKDRDTKFCCF